MSCPIGRGESAAIRYGVVTASLKAISLPMHGRDSTQQDHSLHNLSLAWAWERGLAWAASATSHTQTLKKWLHRASFGLDKKASFKNCKGSVERYIGSPSHFRGVWADDAQTPRK